MSVAGLRVHFSRFWFHYLVMLVFVTAIGIRSTQLNALPLDAHPMRQTDTACVIHFFATDSLNILKPRTCLLRPTTNAEGFFFLEFPAYEWLVAIFQRLISTQSWWTVRVVNLALFTIAFWSLYAGCQRYFNRKLAFWAVLVFSWLPAGMFFFGQAVHPDIFMIATLFLSWYLLTVYIKSGRFWQLGMYLLLLSLSVVTRPFVALSLLPFTLVLVQHRRWLAAVLTLGGPLLPYLAWTEWQKTFPNASHEWQQWVLTGREQLFKFETLKHLIWKNVVGEVMGKMVTILAGWGILSLLFTKTKLKFLFCLVYVAMIPVYWYIVPAGNLAHQYYAHVFIFPLIILAAQALVFVTEKIKPQLLLWPLLLAVIGMTVMNGYRTSRYFYIARIFPEEQAMAIQIANTVPAGERIVYLGQSSLPFSMAYRQGWNTAQPPADLDKTAASVQSVLSLAGYLVVPSYDGTFPPEDLTHLIANLEVASQTEWGAIYRVK